MEPLNRFAAQRTALLELWLERVIATYPSEGGRLLSEEADPFKNPVGHGLRQGLERLVDGLVDGAAPQDFESSLDGLVRVRAVQDFAASEATGFVLLLKGAARELADEDAATELPELERRVDQLLLAAFDVYTRCKSQLAEIRVRDLARRTHSIVERVNRLDAGEPRGSSKADSDHREGGCRA